MYMLMTFNALRDNIEPMLSGITFMVMVFLCLLVTTTRQRGRAGQFSGFSGMIDSLSRTNSNTMAIFISNISLFPYYLVIFAISVAFCRCLTSLAHFVSTRDSLSFVGLKIPTIRGGMASFALALDAIFSSAIFTKRRSMFNFLASTALLCYGWLRHVFFLFKKSCLESAMARTIAGSLHCNRYSATCNIVIAILITFPSVAFPVAGQILDGASNPYEIATVFDQNEIFNIQYAQTDNIMYLVDGTDVPQVLTRAAHDDWTIANADFQTGPFLPENDTAITIAPSATTGSITLTASSAIFSDTAGSTHIGSIWQINQVGGSPSVTGTFASNGTSIATANFQGGYSFTTSGTWAGNIILQRSTNNGISWRNALVPLAADTNYDNPAEIEEDGAIYRATMSNYVSGTATYNITVTDEANKGIVRITAVASDTSATATVLNDLVSTSATTAWREGYWSDFRGWPKTVAFHQQRLVFGGSDTYPQTLWFGKQDPDDYTNFFEGTFDTSAFTVALEGQNPIRWILSQDYLFIGTSGSCGKWGEQGKAVTPTSPNYQEQTRHGGEALRAVLAGDSVLYVERGGRNIREFAFSLQVDKYLTPDLNILSPEITESGIRDIAFQLRPSPILWCVLNNGDLATLTYQRDQSVVAWSKQITDGDFESVAIIPSPTGIEDQVWVSVKRTIDSSDVRYVEQFQPRDWGSDDNDAWFLDSAVSYDGVPEDTFTNAAHLEGETLSIYADLLIENTEIVVSGGFTIDHEASRVLVGLPFTSKLETFPIVIDPQDKAFNKRIKFVWGDFYKTGACKYGATSSSALQNINFKNSYILDAAATAQDLYTSTVTFKKMMWTYGTLKKQTIFIETDQPMPLTVRSLTPDFDLIGN